jgi:hypothetical protein
MRNENHAFLRILDVVFSHTGSLSAVQQECKLFEFISLNDSSQDIYNAVVICITFG